MTFKHIIDVTDEEFDLILALRKAQLARLEHLKKLTQTHKWEDGYHPVEASQRHDGVIAVQFLHWVPDNGMNFSFTHNREDLKT